MTKIFALIFLFLCFGVKAQDDYIPLDHPVYPFLDYLESAKKISEPLLSHRPLTRSYILKQLENTQTQDLTGHEIRMVNHYIAQVVPIKHQKIAKVGGALASRDNFKNGLRDISQYEWDTLELHLLSFQDSIMVMTFDWSEKIRYENWSGETRRIEEDGFFFAGQIGEKIVWSSEFIRYRELHNDNIEIPPVEFKQAYRKTQIGGNFINWDETYGYITFRTNVFQLEFARRPFTWGTSNEHSLIFSNNNAVFPFLGFQVNHRKFNYQFLHGMIMSVADSSQLASGINVGANKYSAAHRVEFFPLNFLSLIYSEMIIYSRESPEFGYMLPVIWFKPLEHNLGDRDNLLIALEGKLILPRIGLIHGAILFDEFVKAKIFKSWWGNKYGIQFGVRLPWRILNRPNLFIVEFTAVRPWVYTHELDVNTYTHNMRGLGFPYGPNSQLTYISDRFMPNERWVIQLSFSQLKHGEPEDDYPIGSDPNDNDSNRNQAYDNSTDFLMGSITITRTFKMIVDYRFSNTLWVWSGFEAVQSNGKDNTIFQFGVRFDY